MSEQDRIAVITDIHANLPALQAVLKTIDDLGIESIYCCGDLVGYGGHLNECIELIRERGIPTVAGNHDHAALGILDVSNFNDVARRAILWTQDILTEENRAYLSALPMTVTDDDVLIVHSSPYNPEKWNYILTIGEARLSFDFFDHICCIGHSHQPFIIENDSDKLTCPTELSVPLRPNCKYLVNAGSVGQPRDQNPMASFCVYKRTEPHLEILRIAYDVDAAQQSIIDQGLPEILAARLSVGS